MKDTTNAVMEALRAEIPRAEDYSIAEIATNGDATATIDTENIGNADEQLVESMVPESEIRWSSDPQPLQQPQPSTVDWTAPRDYRDLVVHELADYEALLHERVASSKRTTKPTGCSSPSRWR